MLTADTIKTLPLDEVRRLYPIVSRYDAVAAKETGAKTMGDLHRIQTALFARLEREDKLFVRRDLITNEQALASAAATLGAKGGAAGKGAAKRRKTSFGSRSGAKAGAAGTGAAKARTPEQASAAARARWAKREPKA